jgi:LEA14-like dessication related protein
MRRLPVLLAATLLLAGCASLQRLAAAAITAPRLKLQQATVAAVDLEGATVHLAFTLENPNDVAFKVARASWRLDVEEARVAEGEVPGGLTLAARGTAPFGVSVRLRWGDVQRLAERAGRQEQVAYRIEGAVGVESPLGVLTLPFTHQGRLPVPRLPAFRLASAAVNLASLTELELLLALEVENPNAFPLPGAALRFDLLVNGVTVAAGREARLDPLVAGGEARLSVPIQVSLLGAGRAAASLHGGGGELRLRGTVRAGGLETPVDLKLELGRR